MRLPLILSTMIAALAIPAALASQATDQKPAAASAEASADSAPAAEAGAAEGEGKKEGAMGKEKSKKRKHHRKRHKPHNEDAGGGIHHTPDLQDLPADEIPSDAGPGKQMPEEMVGQKGPNVPAGQ